MTIFLKSPHNIKDSPLIALVELKFLLLINCGRRFLALSIGPATNCGKKETNETRNKIFSWF